MLRAMLDAHDYETLSAETCAQGLMMLSSHVPDLIILDLVIDFEARMVTVAGEQIHLTQTEYNILSLLADHAGKLLTYTAMNRAIWGANDTGGNKKLQVNMANLRKKLGIRPGDNRYIANELGVGYRIPQPDEDK